MFLLLLSDQPLPFSPENQGNNAQTLTPLGDEGFCNKATSIHQIIVNLFEFSIFMRKVRGGGSQGRSIRLPVPCCGGSIR